MHPTKAGWAGGQAGDQGRTDHFRPEPGQGEGRGGSARGRSRLPRPAVGAPSRCSSAIKPRAGMIATPPARPPTWPRLCPRAPCSCFLLSWPWPRQGPWLTQVTSPQVPLAGDPFCGPSPALLGTPRRVAAGWRAAPGSGAQAGGAVYTRGPASQGDTGVVCESVMRMLV